MTGKWYAAVVTSTASGGAMRVQYVEDFTYEDIATAAADKRVRAPQQLWPEGADAPVAASDAGAGAPPDAAALRSDSDVSDDGDDFSYEYSGEEWGEEDDDSSDAAVPPPPAPFLPTDLLVKCYASSLSLAPAIPADTATSRRLLAGADHCPHCNGGVAAGARILHSTLSLHSP